MNKEARLKILIEVTNYFKNNQIHPIMARGILKELLEKFGNIPIPRQKINNPFEEGCGRDMNTEKKGCVFCGDSEGYFCEECKFIKELIKNIEDKK